MFSVLKTADKKPICARTIVKASVGSVLFLMLVMPVRAETPVDPCQPYSALKFKPVVWDGELVFVMTAPYKTKQLRVWVPIPPSDSMQHVRHSEFVTFPAKLKPQIGNEPVFGNRFAYFEFKEPIGAMMIRHRLTVLSHELHWNLDATRIQAPTSWPESFKPYLRSENQAVVVDARFESLLGEILPQRRNALLDLEAVLKFTDRNFTYNHNNSSLKASSVHAIEQKTGHCSDYHGFCAAMGRAMSLPTRVTYGFNPFPKPSPSHCKLETFLPPYGWVSFDVSETQKLVNAIRAKHSLSNADKEALVTAAQKRLIAGFRDNTYILQTRGTDYELMPPAASKVAVVRTLYAEADGVALPDPDPSDRDETTFAWMTIHQFTSDVPAAYPFEDAMSLTVKQ